MRVDKERIRGGRNLSGNVQTNLTDLFFMATEQYVDPWAAAAMSLLLVSSLYAMQLAFHKAINRYTFMLARDGLLPRPFSLTHPRFELRTQLVPPAGRKRIKAGRKPFGRVFGITTR